MRQRESFEAGLSAHRGMPSRRAEALRGSVRLHNWDKQSGFYTTDLDNCAIEVHPDLSMTVYIAVSSGFKEESWDKGGNFVGVRLLPTEEPEVQCGLVETAAWE